MILDLNKKWNTFPYVILEDNNPRKVKIVKISDSETGEWFFNILDLHEKYDRVFYNGDTEKTFPRYRER